MLDHLICCPTAFTEARDVERKAAELGIIGGSRNKHVNYPLIKGKSDDACANSRKHNTNERRAMRDQLNKLDFGPWTDMPSVVTRIVNSKMI